MNVKQFLCAGMTGALLEMCIRDRSKPVSDRLAFVF